MFQIEAVDKIETYFAFNNFLFFENHALYTIMWKNIVHPDRLQMTI